MFSQSVISSPSTSSSVRILSTSVIVDETTSNSSTTFIEAELHRNPASRRALGEQKIDKRLLEPMRPYGVVPLASVLKPAFEIRLMHLVDQCFEQQQQLLRIPAEKPLQFQDIPLSRYFPEFEVTGCVETADPLTPTTKGCQQLFTVSSLLLEQTDTIFHDLQQLPLQEDQPFYGCPTLERFFEFDPPPGPEMYDRERLYELCEAANELGADVVISPNDCALSLARMPAAPTQHADSKMYSH